MRIERFKECSNNLHEPACITFSSEQPPMVSDRFATTLAKSRLKYVDTMLLIITKVTLNSGTECI